MINEASLGDFFFNSFAPTNDDSNVTAHKSKNCVRSFIPIPTAAAAFVQYQSTAAERELASAAGRDSRNSSHAFLGASHSAAVILRSKSTPRRLALSLGILGPNAARKGRNPHATSLVASQLH